MHIVAFFLLFCTCLFGQANNISSFEMDSSVLIEECVHPLTGDCVIRNKQVLTKGLAPIFITKSYVRDHWIHFPHTELILQASQASKRTKAEDYDTVLLAEPNGYLLTYRQKDKKLYELECPIGFSNTSRGKIHASTSLKNQHLHRLNKFTFKLVTPEGIERIYQKVYAVDQALHFMLQTEYLPNGRTRLYEYDRNHQLIGIKVSDTPHENIYAQCQIEQSGDHILISGGQKSIAYQLSDKERLSKIGNSAAFKYQGDQLTVIEFTKGHSLHLSYTADGRVETLSDKDGKILHSFQYLPNQTRVLHSDKSCTVYHYCTRLLPERIEELDPNNVVQKTTSFLWDGWGHLLEKKETDSQGHLLFCAKFRYDKRYNPIQEERLGFTIDRTFNEKDQLVKEVCSKNGATFKQETWEYNHFQLSSHTDPEGNTTRYAYNDLGLKEKEILQTSIGNLETLFFYDDAELLVKTKRGPLITTYKYNEDQVIDRVEEFDQDSHLISSSPAVLKKEVDPLPSHDLPGVHKIYDGFGRLTALYTDDETVHYTLTYNKCGQIATVTDEITEQRGERHYDEVGNLISETLLNGHTLISTYDLYGRRIQFTLPDQSSIYYRWGAKYLEQIHRITHKNRYEYIHRFTGYNLDGLPTKQRLIEGFGLYEMCSNANRMIDSLTSYHFKQSAQTLFSENFAQAPKSYTFTRDGLGRIVKFHQGNRTTTFSYDIWNRRMTKTVVESPRDPWKPPVHLAFLYDDQKEIGTINLENNKLYQLRVCAPHPINPGDQAVAYEIDGLLYAPMHDLYGNVKTLLSVIREKPIESYTFSPTGSEEITASWGSVLSKSKAHNPWRFRCERVDDETGLLYIDGDYYDPALGQFLGDSSRKLSPPKLFTLPSTELPASLFRQEEF